MQKDCEHPGHDSERLAAGDAQRRPAGHGGQYGQEGEERVFYGGRSVEEPVVAGQDEGHGGGGEKEGGRDDVRRRHGGERRNDRQTNVGASKREKSEELLRELVAKAGKLNPVWHPDS